MIPLIKLNKNSDSRNVIMWETNILTHPFPSKILFFHSTLFCSHFSLFNSLPFSLSNYYFLLNSILYHLETSTLNLSLKPTFFATPISILHAILYFGRSSRSVLLHHSLFFFNLSSLCSLIEFYLFPICVWMKFGVWFKVGSIFWIRDWVCKNMESPKLILSLCWVLVKFGFFL